MTPFNENSTVQYIFETSLAASPESGLFVLFVALRPKSTAMAMAEGSVHLATLFSWASLNKQLTHTFACI